MTATEAEKPITAPTRSLPQNVEAEQALLGAIMYDNAAYDRAEGLEPEHFFEPGHGRLFAAMSEAMRLGSSAEPILLGQKLQGDPAIGELGGLRYLADLVDRAPPAVNVGDYARAIIDTAKRRTLIRIGETIISEAEGGHENPLTASEQVERAEAALFAVAEAKGQGGGFRGFSDCIDGFMETVTKAMDNDGRVSGLSTGLIDVDAKTGGLHPSDLIILAGRPGAGKTALATNIAFTAAIAGHPVAFYSLEMSGEQLAGRILSDRSGVSGDRIRKGQIDASEYGRLREAAHELKTLPIHIDDGGGTSIAKIVARARRLKRQKGLALVVVDYIQLSKGSGGANTNRVQEIGEISGGLKSMAKDLHIPVIGLSQLSRQVETRDDKRPRLSDLRESGALEQDADMVWFVYREAYYLQQAEPKEGTKEHLDWQDAMAKAMNRAELIIAKQRHGPVGTVQLAFDSNTTRFGNLAREAYSPWGGE